MNYLGPREVARTMVSAAGDKAGLSTAQLLLRGSLSGALPGVATSLAFTVTAQGLPPIAGAVLFPAGFAMIILLSLELVTGSFALLSLTGINKQASPGRIARNLLWVYLGNLVGGVAHAALFAAIQTQFGHTPVSNAGGLIWLRQKLRPWGTRGWELPGCSSHLSKLFCAIGWPTWA